MVRTCVAAAAPERQVPCLVANAGKPLTTGTQAECYANEFIGLHLASSSEGRTYAELGTVQSGLRAQIAEAQRTGAPNLAGLQEEMADVSSQRETVFKGEALRVMLLTSYGFSVLGDKGAQAATVSFVAAALMALLSIAGFVHAFHTPRSKAFAAPEADETESLEWEIARV